MGRAGHKEVLQTSVGPGFAEVPKSKLNEDSAYRDRDRFEFHGQSQGSTDYNFNNLQGRDVDLIGERKDILITYGFSEIVPYFRKVALPVLF